MGRTVVIGIQSFSDLVLNDCFYIGKTLTMNMVEYKNNSLKQKVLSPQRFSIVKATAPL